MKIAGLEKCSLIDYPGMLSAVCFTPGCNLNCFYCHNRDLLHDGARTTLATEEVLHWLDKRRGFLDGVVITGGEPTLQPDLAYFIRAVHARGFKVKLDTNGVNPEALEALLAEDLLDYVAMDVKAPPARYAEICGVRGAVPGVEASIDLLLNCAVDYEFRTTVIPQLAAVDVLDIAKWIQGARLYVLQQFRRPANAGARDDIRNAAPPHRGDWPEAVLPLIRPLVTRCALRGFDSVARQEKAPQSAAAMLAD